MNTSPIVNATNVSPNPVAPSKQADGNSSDVSFNQRLSREIADRNTRDDAAQTSANRSQDAKPAGPQSQAPAKAANADSSEQSRVKDGKNPKDETAIDSDPSATAYASPEILALVANLTQAAAQAIDPKTAAITATSTGLPALDDVKNRGAESQTAEKLITAASDKHDFHLDSAVKQLSAQVQPVDTAASAKAAKPDSEFAAVLNHSNETNQGLAAANDKAVEQTSVTSPVVPPAASAIVAPSDAVPADANISKQDLGKDLPAAGLAPLQQAVLDKIQAAAGHPTDKIAPRVGTPAWDQAVGQKVVWMVAGAQQSASMTLNPPDLGPLQIVLNVTNSHADATFFAAQPEVRQAIEAALPKLREMMSDAGIQLGQTSVSAGTPNDPRANGDQSQQASRRHDSGGTVVEPTISTQAVRSQRIVGGQGLVDTFA